jgi:carbonic anhydrase/acetyltransferase-like protein (isoleucine patch superfamily)
VILSVDQIGSVLLRSTRASFWWWDRIVPITYQIMNIIGPRVRILYGAVLTAEGHFPLTVGQNCVIMEQAVLRAAGRWGLELGDYVLVGPHAYLSGCTIGVGSFIATGAMVFNGARLGTACVVALGGKVHIETDLPDNTFVPIGFIAIGRPR